MAKINLEYKVVVDDDKAERKIKRLISLLEILDTS